MTYQPFVLVSQIQPKSSICTVSNKIGFLQLNDSQMFREIYMEFANSEVSLSFSVPFQYSIEEIADFVLKWLLSTESTHQFSMVGAMSSVEFTSVIASHLGSELATYFKTLIYTASHLRNSSHIQTVERLVVLLPCVEFSGFQLLKQLEQLVSPRKFGRLSVKARLALFLVLIGTIISAKYYQQFTEVCFPLTQKHSCL